MKSVLTTSKMAAPLKRVGLVWTNYKRCLPASCVRNASDWKTRKSGPPPWMVKQLPSGRTSYALMLTEMQNNTIWRKRMMRVNRGWQQTLKDYNKTKKQREETAAAEPDQETPPKLLLVRQVITEAGIPYWEKNALKELRLEKGKVTIVKNKENTGKILSRVKHLVEVHPVTFPFGLPESEEDYAHCVLRDNGEFVVMKKLKPANEETSVQVTAEHQDNVWEIKQELLDETLERRKKKYQVHQEYFPTRYLYKRNQDGKEYRYKGDQSIGVDKDWH